MQSSKKTTITTNTQNRPDFGKADSMVGADYDNRTDIYNIINK